MSALVDMHAWLPRAVRVYDRVQSASRRGDPVAVRVFPSLRSSMERGRHLFGEAERRRDSEQAGRAIECFRDVIARCPFHLTTTHTSTRTP